MASYLTKVTSKGQVTIPKAVRERFAIEAGDYLLFEPEGDELIVRKGKIVKEESSEADVDALLDTIAKHFEERGITRTDVEDAIRWAREK